jgi:hypothetical protein
MILVRWWRWWWSPGELMVGGSSSSEELLPLTAIWLFTRGVAVSITGCRLRIRLSWIFFYRQPNRQASTTCPYPHAETAELSDAVFTTARKIQELK